MAYIGRGIENFSQIEVLDNITFTNSAGPYNILKSAVAFIPSTVNSLLIEVDGIIQAPASYTIDQLSNGFKVRVTSADINASGGSYICMAFGQPIISNGGVCATAR